MKKFKYSVYDYSKIGIPKQRVFCRHVCSFHEWEGLKSCCFNANDAATVLMEALKRETIYVNPQYSFDPNFCYEWEVITPEKSFNFYETSSEKKQG